MIERSRYMEVFFAQMTTLLQQKSVLVYCIIFFGKLVEVTISTLRIVLINRGVRLAGSILAMLEIILWVIIVSNVLTGLSSDPLKGIFYALAFAAGNYIGSWLDEKLAFGLSSVQIVVSDVEQANKLTKIIRQQGYGITTLNVQGMNENTRYMMLVMIRRKCLHEVLEIVNEVSSSAVITVSDVKVQKGGYLRNSPTRHMPHPSQKQVKLPWERVKLNHTPIKREEQPEKTKTSEPVVAEKEQEQKNGGE